MNPQVHNDPKGISMGSMDFDSPYIYGDTSIFDGLVQINAAHVTEACLVRTPLITWNYLTGKKGKSIQITKPILKS